MDTLPLVSHTATRVNQMLKCYYLNVRIRCREFSSEEMETGGTLAGTPVLDSTLMSP